MLCAVNSIQYLLSSNVPALPCWALWGRVSLTEELVTSSLGNRTQGYFWAAVSFGQACILLHSQATGLGAGDDRVASQPCQWVTIGGKPGLPNGVLGLHWVQARTYPSGDSHHVSPDVAWGQVKQRRL